MARFSIPNAHYFTMYLVPKLLTYAKSEGIDVFMGEVQRFPERQRELVNSGASWTLNSDHLLCTAVDFEFLERDRKGNLKWIEDPDHPNRAKLAAYWKSLNPGCYWGGDWASKDTPHFGYRPRKED